MDGEMSPHWRIRGSGGARRGGRGRGDIARAQFRPKCCNCLWARTGQSGNAHFHLHSLSCLYLLIFVSKWKKIKVFKGPLSCGERFFNSTFCLDTTELKPKEWFHSEAGMNSKWVLFYFSLVLYTELDPWFLQITFPKGPPYNAFLFGCDVQFYGVKLAQRKLHRSSWSRRLTLYFYIMCHIF